MAVMANPLPRNNALPRPVCFLVCLLPATVFAASDWKVTSGMTLAELYTDNVSLAADGGQSAFITQISPRIGMSRQGKRGNVSLTYSPIDLLYDSGKNRLYNNLIADMQVEPVAGVFKLNGNARVGQGYASQFGPTSQYSNTALGGNQASQFGSTSQSLYNTVSNQVETRSVSLTPSLHNEFFDSGLITDASLGLNYASAGSGALGNSTSDTLNFAFHNGPRPDRLTYSGYYKRNSADSSGAPTSTFDSENYTVGYVVRNRTRVFLSAGRNSTQGVGSLQGLGGSYQTGGVTWFPTNYFSLTGTVGQSGGSGSYSLSSNWSPSRKINLAATVGRRNNNSSYNLSGSWAPSVLTSLSASAQKNFDAATFGVSPATYGVGTSAYGVGTGTNGLSSYGYTSYALNLNHRVRRAVVGLRYTESVVDASQQINQTANFPFYLCGNQFQPVVQGQPMPVGCVPVSVALPYTQLLNQTTYNKTWAGTLNFSLGRSALAFTLSQSRVQSLGYTGGNSQQQGATANWSLPISARSSTSLGLNWSKAQAASTTQVANQQSDSWLLYWTLAHQISPRVTSSLNAHHSEQRITGATGDIKENAVSAQLGMTF